MKTSFTFTLDDISHMSPSDIADHLSETAKQLRSDAYRDKTLKPYHSNGIALTNPYKRIGSWNIAYHDD